MFPNEQNKLTVSDPEFSFASYLDVFLKRRWIVLAGWIFVVATTVFYTYRAPVIYQASSLLIIEKERNYSNSLYQVGSIIERDNDDYYQTQYKLLKSETLLKAVYNKLELSKVKEFSSGYGHFRDAVQISPASKSRLVYVRASSLDPKLASLISNAISQTYIEQNLGNQLFISKDVLNALQNNQSEAESRKIFESLPAVVNNALIQNLKQETATLQAEVAELSGRYQNRHPKLRSLRDKLKVLEGHLNEETEKIIRSLKIDLSGQLMGNNIRLIDAAVTPVYPISPNKTLNILLAAIGGLGFGLFLAIFADIMDRSLRTHENIEKELKIPMLGLVPYVRFKKGRNLYNRVHLSDRTLFSESIRNTRTMVALAEAVDHSRAFILTSAEPAAGKSFLSANLAVSMAKAGERVLLVDGNLRKASLHLLFDIPVAGGLSNFLASSGPIDELSIIARHTDVAKLHLMPCGSIPLNPAELLSAPRLSAFMAWALARYDRVVIDCPSLSSNTDALLWGRHVRNCVFVVKYGVTKAPTAMAAVTRLQTAGIKILGAVINMSRRSGIVYHWDPHYGYIKENLNSINQQTADTLLKQPPPPPGMKNNRQ